MAGELTVPILPCRLLDELLPFYEALGFEITFRQARPNPYAVVRREDIRLHFCQPEGFEPEHSYASAILVVPDADALYEAFSNGLRATYGRLPTAGIPRILRPRRKLGTVAGFSVVDPGGNWLRVYRAGDSEEDEQPRVTGLALVLRSAARQGDSRGAHDVAISMLDTGLARHGEAPVRELLSALVYRAELAVRVGDRSGAAAALAAIRELELDEDDRAALAGEIATATEIERWLA